MANVAVLQALGEARRGVIQSTRGMIRWRLRVVMADRDINNQQLAEQTKLNPVTVSKLKTAKELPQLKASTLNSLCKVLNCTPNDLIEYIPDAEVQQ